MESSYKDILKTEIQVSTVEKPVTDDPVSNKELPFEQHKDDVMDVLTKSFFDLCSYWQQFGFMDKTFNVGEISARILETINFQQLVDDDDDDDEDVYDDY